MDALHAWSRSSIRRLILGLGVLAGMGLVGGVQAASSAGEPIALGLIEGFSGSFANAGDSVWRNIQFAVDRVNARGGVRLGERVHRIDLIRFDSKGQTDEALTMLQRAIDQHSRFILQGNSSTVAAALVEAIERHNARAPDTSVLFLNYSAVDPLLTNERCSFWHFRFDAHVGMRMKALVDAMAANPTIRKVYLLNQDYSFGQQVAQMARQMLAERRPDISIVGDELHPLGRIKDFTPYAAKIQAAGADTVLTGNWGNDLTLLVRAAREAGLSADFYTFYGNGLGAPAAIGDAGVDRVRAVAEWHPNAGLEAAVPIYEAFRASLADPRHDYFNIRHVIMIEMLVGAIEAAQSVEPADVARALEGRDHSGAPYTVHMRAADHQLLTPLYVSVMARAGPGAGSGAPPYDLEASGFGFVTERRLSADETQAPHRCEMRRPRAIDG